MAASKKERDWKTAGQEALTTALKRLEIVASDCSDAKTLESIAKTVGDIVGASLYFGRGQATAKRSEGSDDDD